MPRNRQNKKNISNSNQNQETQQKNANNIKAEEKRDQMNLEQDNKEKQQDQNCDSKKVIEDNEQNTLIQSTKNGNNEASSRKSRKQRKEIRNSQNNTQEEESKLQDKNLEQKQKVYNIPVVDLPNFENNLPNQKDEKRIPGMNDYLLEDFQDSIKENIIKELYPSLKQAMMHFVQQLESNETLMKKIQNKEDIKRAGYLNKQEIDQINNNGENNQSVKQEIVQQNLEQKNSLNVNRQVLNVVNEQQITPQKSSFGSFQFQKSTINENNSQNQGNSCFQSKQQCQQASQTFGSNFKMNTIAETINQDNSQIQQNNTRSNFNAFKMVQNDSNNSAGDSFQFKTLEQIDKNVQILEQNHSANRIFLKCFDDYINKRLVNLNPHIFRTNKSQQPNNFVQKIPNQDSYQKKRGSVFQKVDLSCLDFDNIPEFKKSKKQIIEIVPLLKKNFLTKNLNDSEIEKLAGAMKPMKFLKKEIIIKYGDIGSTYFILSKGSVKVTVYKQGTPANSPDLENNKLFTKYMGQGSGFGELALLYNDKRSATIEAVDNCETYTLDGSIFKTIIIKSSIQKRSMKADFLEKIKLFDKLDKFQKLKLVDGLQSITLNKLEFVFKEGTTGEEFYIIESGEVECLKLYKVGQKTGFVLVRCLSNGHHFGELALINNEPRSLSIRVKSDTCKLLKLDRDAFTRILGSIEQHLKKDYDNELETKMDLIKTQKRTLSQTFSKNAFQVINEDRQDEKDVMDSCGTIIQNNIGANMRMNEVSSHFNSQQSN